MRVHGENLGEFDACDVPPASTMYTGVEARQRARHSRFYWLTGGILAPRWGAIKIPRRRKGEIKK